MAATTIRRSYPALTQALVIELLDYNPGTGTLIWRERDRKWFKSDGQWRNWNARLAGKPALACVDPSGYLRGGIFNKHHRAHRIIWLLVTGKWPFPQIEHENQNRADNRWRNLSQATQQQNLKNQSLRRDNKTGYVGVSRWRGGYRAQITVNGKRHWLGNFGTKEEAIAVRLAASKEHGFSVRHGWSSLSADERNWRPSRGILPGE